MSMLTRSKQAQPEIVLPPPFSLVTLREVGDAHARAVELAGDSGAGTLVYVGRFDLAEFAVVLEPDMPLRQARRAFHAGMVALSDAIVAFAPPEVPVQIGWPDAINVNLGLVGGARFATPPGCADDEVPRWLVFSAMVRVVSMGEEPGVHPLVTALDEEGFDDFRAQQLVESFARNLMKVWDSWTEAGFGPVSKTYLSRLQPEDGVRREIDDNGDLLAHRIGRTGTPPERRSLVSALAAPSWYDPARRGPRS